MRVGLCDCRGTMHRAHPKRHNFVSLYWLARDLVGTMHPLHTHKFLWGGMSTNLQIFKNHPGV